MSHASANVANLKEEVFLTSQIFKYDILESLRKLSAKQLKSLKLENLNELQAYDLSVRFANAAGDSFYQQSELQRECYSAINKFIRQVDRERKLAG